MNTDIPEHYSIILVHGTWGRGFFPKPATIGSVLGSDDLLRNSRWFEPGSAFRRQLSKSLNLRMFSYDIRHVEWCGSNSLSARSVAGKNLADTIRQVQAENPKAKVVCIGHSHGGNVILQAVKHLKPDECNIEIITLATPFIDVYDFGGLRHAFSNKLAFLTTVFLLLCVSLFILFEPNWAVQNVDSESLMILGPFVLLVGALGLAFFYSLFLTGGFLVSRKPVPISSLMPLSTYDLTGNSSLSLLAIRGVDDEASLVLAISRIGAKLNYFLLLWAEQNTLIHIIGGAFVMGLATRWSASAPDLARALCVVVLVMALGLPLLTALFRATAGRELLFAGADTLVSVNSTPDTTRWDLALDPPEISAVTISTDSQLRSLRHFLHESKQCTEHMAVWLNRHRLRVLRAERAAKRQSLA